MKYFISLDELDKKIEYVKLKLLSVDNDIDKKKLYITLDGLFTLRYIIKYNRDSSYKIKIKDFFFFNKPKRQMEKFCDINNYEVKFDIKSSEETLKFIKTDLINYVLDIYDIGKISTVGSNVNKKFSQDEVVSIVKDVYKYIDNFEITSNALDILNSDHVEFVKEMPYCYKFVAGLFVLDDYILVKNDKNSIYDVVRLAHEVAHYIDSVLSVEFIDKKEKSEWFAMTIGFIALKYMKENAVITKEEYNSILQNEFGIISEYIDNTILYDRSESEYLTSLAFASSYAFSQVVCKNGKVNGDELSRYVKNKDGFIKFNRENHDFIIDEFKKIKRLVR